MTWQRSRGLAREFDLTEINMVGQFRCIDAVPSIPREAPMRIPALAILTVAMVSAAPSARAQTYSPDYPVCLQAVSMDGGVHIDCSYTSLAQCAQSASGRAAECIINPYFAGAQAPRERHDRRHPRAN